jgi:hypothetical protein
MPKRNLDHAIQEPLTEPRMIDETYTGPDGIRHKRYGVKQNFHWNDSGTGINRDYVIVNKETQSELWPPDKPNPLRLIGGYGFRTREAARTWLKKTTVRRLKVLEVRNALDGI